MIYESVRVIDIDVSKMLGALSQPGVAEALSMPPIANPLEGNTVEIACLDIIIKRQAG